MGIKEKIKALVATESTTLTNVASKMKNNKNKDRRLAMNSVIQKLTKETIRYTEVEEILKILGYEIKIEKIK